MFIADWDRSGTLAKFQEPVKSDAGQVRCGGLLEVVIARMATGLGGLRYLELVLQICENFFPES